MVLFVSQHRGQHTTDHAPTLFTHHRFLVSYVLLISLVFYVVFSVFVVFVFCLVPNGACVSGLFFLDFPIGFISSLWLTMVFYLPDLYFICAQWLLMFVF
jgi:hypothetical protein